MKPSSSSLRILRRTVSRGMPVPAAMEAAFTARCSGTEMALAMPFTTSPQRDHVVIGLAANTVIADPMSVRYEVDIPGRDGTHAITAGLRMMRQTS